MASVQRQRVSRIHDGRSSHQRHLELFLCCSKPLFLFETFTRLLTLSLSPRWLLSDTHAALRLTRVDINYTPLHLLDCLRREARGEGGRELLEGS